MPTPSSAWSSTPNLTCKRGFPWFPQEEAAMPELSDDLNALFAAEASVKASPSRGVSELARAARGGRRRRQAGVATLAACGALVVGVAATVGAGAVGPGPAIPGQGGSPSPSLGSVTWDPEGAV